MNYKKVILSAIVLLGLNAGIMKATAQSLVDTLNIIFKEIKNKRESATAAIAKQDLDPNITAIFHDIQSQLGLLQTLIRKMIDEQVAAENMTLKANIGNLDDKMFILEPNK